MGWYVDMVREVRPFVGWALAAVFVFTPSGMFIVFGQAIQADTTPGLHWVRGWVRWSRWSWVRGTAAWFVVWTLASSVLQGSWGGLVWIAVGGYLFYRGGDDFWSVLAEEDVGEALSIGGLMVDGFVGVIAVLVVAQVATLDPWGASRAASLILVFLWPRGGGGHHLRAPVPAVSPG